MISIIVPCWNVSKFLPDCFKCLNAQKYQNVEIIFVNDGSTDDTLINLEKYCSGKENCRIINQQNQGVSSARNTGLADAKGEFIYFFDPDDAFHPSLLTRLHQQIQNYDISICDYKTVNENFKFSNVKSKRKHKAKIFNDTENLLVQLLSSKLFRNIVWNKLYRHSLLKKMKNYPNVFDGRIMYGSDLAYNVEYLSFCKNAIYLKEKLYYYRSRKNSIVHTKFKTKLLSIFYGHENNLKICEKYDRALQYAKASICISCVEMLFRIYASDYADKEIIQKLFDGMKSNMKSLKKSKKIQRYKRWTIPLVPPILKILLNKRLK